MKAIEEGLYAGFSHVYSYMAAADKLEWWKSLLVNFSHWGRGKSALNKKVSLPQPSSKDPQTLNSLFRIGVDYVFFEQAEKAYQLKIPYF